jgi:hypothetical protein
LLSTCCMLRFFPPSFSLTFSLPPAHLLSTYFFVVCLAFLLWQWKFSCQRSFADGLDSILLVCPEHLFYIYYILKTGLGKGFYFILYVLFFLNFFYFFYTVLAYWSYYSEILQRYSLTLPALLLLRGVLSSLLSKFSPFQTFTLTTVPNLLLVMVFSFSTFFFKLFILLFVFPFLSDETE